MKKVLIITFVALAVAGVVAYQVSHWHTEQYIKAMKAEMVLLENTFLEAAEAYGKGAVTESEARSFSNQIRAHLNTIEDHPASVNITGFTEEHQTSILDVIRQLEEFLVTHDELLLALAEDTADASEIDPSDFPIDAVATSAILLATSTAPVAEYLTLNDTIDNLSSYLD